MVISVKFAFFLSLIQFIKSLSDLTSDYLSNDTQYLRSLGPVSNSACSTWIFKQINDVFKFEKDANEMCNKIKASKIPSSQQKCSECKIRIMNHLYFIERYAYASTICLVKTQDCPGFDASPVIEELQSKLSDPWKIYYAFEVVSNITRKEFEYDAVLPSSFYIFECIEHTEEYYTYRIKSRHPTPIECYHDMYLSGIEEPYLTQEHSKFYIQPDNLDGVLVSETFIYEHYDDKDYQVSLNCTAMPNINTGTYKTFDVITIKHKADEVCRNKDLNNILNYPFTKVNLQALTTTNPKVDITTELENIKNENNETMKIELVKVYSDANLLIDNNITENLQGIIKINEAISLVNCKGSPTNETCLKSLTEIQKQTFSFSNEKYLKNLLKQVDKKNYTEANIKLYFMALFEMFNNPYTLDFELGKLIMRSLGPTLQQMKKYMELIKKYVTVDLEKVQKDVINIATQTIDSAIVYKSLINNIQTYYPYTAKSQFMMDIDLIAIKNGVLELGSIFAEYKFSNVETRTFKYQLLNVPTTRILQSGDSTVSFPIEKITVSIPVNQIKKSLSGNVKSIGVISFLDYPLLSLIGKSSYSPNVVSVEAYDNLFGRTALDNLTENTLLTINYDQTGANQDFIYCYYLNSNVYSTNMTKNETVGSNLECKSAILGEMIISRINFNEEPSVFIIDLGKDEDVDKPPFGPDNPGEPISPDNPLIPEKESESLWWIALITLLVVGLLSVGAFLFYKFYWKSKQAKKFESIETGRSVNTVNTVGIELSSKPNEVQITRSQFNPLKRA